MKKYYDIGYIVEKESWKLLHLKIY
jgi:hypothetical protein